MKTTETRLTRRSFALGTLAGTVGATALGAPTILRAQNLTRIRVTQPAESLSYMAIYAARARGLFEQNGIDLEVVITRGDGPDVQALMAREVEFLATPPHHLFTLHHQNRRLLGICGILGRCGINLVISPAIAAERGVSEDSPIEEKLEALRGLRIGASAPGSLTYNIAEYYVLRAGMQPQVDAQVLSSGTGPAAVAAMQNNVVDAYSFSTPLTDQLVQMGAAEWLINNTRGQDPELQEFLHAVIYARPDYIERNEDLVRRFVASVVDASTWVRETSIEDVAAEIRPFFDGLDEDVYRSAIGNVREAIIADGVMTEAGSETYQDVLLQTGHLSAPVEFDAVFTNEFLPAVG